MKIFSWNVNGLRACTRKGFLPWLHATEPTILGVQEVRALPQQLDPDVLAPAGYHVHLAAAEKKGYSGVGLFSTLAPDDVATSLGVPEFDCEGRLQLATYGELLIANVYFPNGNGKNRDNSRIPYKLAFYERLYEVLEPARAAGQPILVMGDFNTAHHEIDLARPKQNRKTSGFRPEERAELDRWVDSGWTDTFRSVCPDPERYSWWSQRSGARERNVGWRIDMILASPGAMPHLEGAEIHADVLGSDHCPISVHLNEAVLRS